jgi:hypothetical protein
MLDFRFFLATYAALGVSPAFAAGTAALPATPGAKTMRHRAKCRRSRGGIGSAEERLVNLKTVSTLMPPSIRSHSGNKFCPIARQYENKNGRKKPEGPPDQVRANIPDFHWGRVAELFDPRVAPFRVIRYSRP